MRFDQDSIAYQIVNLPEKITIESGTIAVSDAAGELKFYTNGNVVVSWDHHIMQGGKGFNQGSPYDDFGDDSYPDTTYNVDYGTFAYQVIPDPYDGYLYYMVHALMMPGEINCEYQRVPKMQISKIDMSANGGKGVVVYKNRYFDEGFPGGLGFALVRHGNGRDWWVVRQSHDGLAYHSALLYRDSVVQVVESEIPGLSSDWFDCLDRGYANTSLLQASRDGSMLVDNFGAGWAKLMGFDRCSGEVGLIDTINTGITLLEVSPGEIWECPFGIFEFSPSGRYLYGAGWADFAQWDLLAADIAASKVKLGGVPWALNDDQAVLVGSTGGFTAFAHGPDGRIYNLMRTAHSVIEYPDEPGEASGLCLAADNAPVSCLGPDVPYWLFSGRHPNFRLCPLTGSGCDTILSSVSSPALDGGFGIMASPTVASGQVEVAITLPSYGSQVTAEIQVVDMLGRVVHQHRFPPYAYLHRLDVSGWASGLYNVVLLEKGRARAAARLVVAR